MIRNIFFINLLFCLLFFTSSGNAKELKIALSYDIPPFIADEGTTGLEIDIIRKSLQFKNHTFTVVQAPYKRLQVAVAEMGIDAAAAVRENTWDGTYYSNDFVFFQNVAITHKESNISLQSIEDLKGKSILAWQNAYRDLGLQFKSLFSPEVHASYAKKYREVPVQKNQVDMFIRGRAEVLIIDESIFRWFAKQMVPQENWTEFYVFHHIFAPKTAFKINFKEEQLRDDFNEGLQHIRSNGEYLEILNKYLK